MLIVTAVVLMTLRHSGEYCHVVTTWNAAQPVTELRSIKDSVQNKQVQKDKKDHISETY